MSAVEKFEHRRFGELQTDASSVIEFPGLPGFPRARRFVVRGHDLGSAFAWLISLDDPELAFVIADPWAYVPAYRPSLDSRSLAAIDCEPDDELHIVSLVTFPDSALALNLAAPLVINLRSRKGHQVVLEDDAYSLREIIEAPSE